MADLLFKDRLPYKRYIATLTQLGVVAPTATVLENTIGAIVFTRTGTGTYSGTLVGMFPNPDKVVILNNPSSEGSGYTTQIAVVLQTNDNFKITTFDASTFVATDGILESDCIEIRIYP